MSDVAFAFLGFAVSPLGPPVLMGFGLLALFAILGRRLPR
jgi:uncharacterized protein (TIGR03382 family)